MIKLRKNGGTSSRRTEERKGIRHILKKNLAKLLTGKIRETKKNIHDIKF